MSPPLKLRKTSYLHPGEEKEEEEDKEDDGGIKAMKEMDVQWDEFSLQL